jgi:hypothetical protein
MNEEKMIVNAAMHVALSKIHAMSFLVGHTSVCGMYKDMIVLWLIHCLRCKHLVYHHMVAISHVH